METMLTSPPLHAWFRPMGLFCQITSNSMLVIDAATAAFGGYGQCEPVESPDIRCCLVEVDTADVSLEPRYEVRTGVSIVEFTGGGTRVALDTRNGEATGTIAANLARRPAALRYHVLQFILASMLARRGFLGIHAAGCVLNGSVILLRGPSGSGKTATAYACVKAGWQTLGESVIWIDTRNGGKCAWGMPWYFHFPREATALFPELPSGPVLTAGGRDRLEIEVESVQAGSAVTHASPAAIVFLAAGGNAIRRLSREQAAVEWPAGAAGMETDFPDYERQIGRLLQMPVWAMAPGLVAAAPDLLGKVLAESTLAA
jgi:hypothetical protein